MAAYSRATPDKTFMANILKSDDQDAHIRCLIDGIAKLLNKDAATIQSDSMATLTAALVSAGVTA